MQWAQYSVTEFLDDESADDTPTSQVPESAATDSVPPFIILVK